MAKAKVQRRLVLLDAHAIIHRAYHALPDFSSSRGEPTGALYGLSAMLIRIIADLKPDYMAAAFDLPKPTYRHEAYKEYKAGRAKADDALVTQLQRSRDVFAAFGIPIYDKEGFEADDIIGTIVEKLQATSYKLQPEVIIASGDMDTLQLVDDRRVRVFTLKKGITDTVMYDEEAVKKRFGFAPELLPDFKGLKGDPSDNIKGIKGIGEKTATTLIQTFGTIEEMYKALKKDRGAFLKAGISERVVGLLEAGKEEAEFSKLLGTIRLDAPIDFSLPERLWRETADLAKAEALFAELEFRTLPERLRAALGKGIGNRESGIENEKKKSKNEKMEKLQATSYKLQASVPSPSQPSFNDALQTAAISPEELSETAVALWLVNSNLTDPKLDDILGFARTRDFKKAREIVLKELRKRNLIQVFDMIEKPLVPVVRRMNEKGVAIDVSYLKKLSKEYHTELAKREKAIWKLAGEEFNVASPKQLGVILFSKLGLKAKNQKKTAGGALSTKESELEKMRELHPIIGSILEYREFAKLLTTYIDTIPGMVDETGRLHANFLQAGTTTGRMGSEKPNLQNIPNHTELGKRIRH
ncbi:MAG: DNA polymerase I, partial [Parcubacteria group bacterium Gr01-1014_72]